jgi:WD40 repeat protein
LRRIRFLADARPEAEAEDARLLRLFAQQRDEFAFAAIVRRHGPMVLGVCQRTLYDADDADDAFQATFLVLARKADSLRDGSALGGWLHRVALHIALRSRSARARQGKTLVSIDVGPTVRIWDVATGKERLKLAPEEGRWRVVCFALSPDGKSVAVGGEGETHIWDTNTGKLVRRLDVKGWMHSLAFAPDGKTMAASDRGGRVHLWETATWTPTRVIQGDLHSHADSLSFSGDGKTLAVGSDGSLLICDLESGTQKKGQPCGSRSTRQTSVEFAPKGPLLALANNDPALRFWDVSAEREAKLELGPAVSVVGLAFTPDGQTLVTSGGKSVRFWDTTSGRETTGQRGHEVFGGHLAFSPDGKLLVLGGSESGIFGNPMVWGWDTVTGKERFHFKGHKYSLGGVIFFPDGKRFVTAGTEGSVMLRALAEGATEARVTAEARMALERIRGRSD